MKESIIKIVQFSFLIFLISCSTMQYNINKNNDFTKKQIGNLLQKNGNVFYLSSSNATFSTVWSYSSNEIEIYKLAKGMISKREFFSETEFTKPTVQSLQDIDKEIYQQCPLELDGDNFGFRVIIDGDILTKDYHIEINCLKAGRYNTNFSNKIVNDITIRDMWDVEYF